MKRLTFKCTLLSDIIINAQTATEGTQETLDFIPGSNFLGIVAKHYSSFDNSYDIFHSDKVRFGDAHLAKNNEKSFKAPLSWFNNKGDKNTNKIWVHHGLKKEIRDQLTKNDIQLKQIRYGWVFGDGSMLKTDNNFAIKSAYDRGERRSKDGAIFGYKSLESGTEWIFYVDIIDETIDQTKIIDKLIGEHNVGKSKSAQYGRVKIEPPSHNLKSNSSNDLIDEKIVIYAESRLAFYDKYGQPNLRPEAKDFNLAEDFEICWDLCQVKHQIFAPYNGKIKNREADRVCFQKGSVFVFKGKGDFDPNQVESGIGSYLNEGFGQVIVNPQFLKYNNDGELIVFVLKEPEHPSTEISSIRENDISDTIFIDWLYKKEQKESDEEKIYIKIKNFVERNADKFKYITPSQWGQVRAIVSTSKTIDDFKNALFKKSESSSIDGEIRSTDRANSGFLEHGKIAEKWKSCKKILEDEINNNSHLGLDYIERLAAQMQKIAKNKENRRVNGGDNE